MLFLIALGGALGTAARWQLSHWFPTPAGGIPWVTLGINVVGSFILGLLARYFLTHATSPAVVAAMTVGLCGGFTTFSAFSGDTLRLRTANVVLLHRHGVGNQLIAHPVE